MSKIRVEIDQVLPENKRLKKLNAQMGEVKEWVHSLRGQVDDRITQRRNLDSRFYQANNDLKQLENKLDTLYHLVEYSMDKYIQTE